MEFLHNPQYNFIKWRWHAIGLSLLVILAGLAMIATRGLQLGIDFSGGTLVVVRFEQAVEEGAVRQALEKIPGDKVIQPYGDASNHEWLIRLPQETSEQEDLEKAGRAVLDALQAANIGKFELLQRDSVGPVVGRDLQLKGIYATL